MHSLYTAMVPGMMMPRTLLAIFACSSCQAASISSRRPLVQLPITTWSTGMRCAWASAAVVGVLGQVGVYRGSSAARSISMVCSYSASVGLVDT